MVAQLNRSDLRQDRSSLIQQKNMQQIILYWCQAGSRNGKNGDGMGPNRQSFFDWFCHHLMAVQLQIDRKRNIFLHCMGRMNPEDKRGF